jgi:hypothetical protein
VVVAVVVVYGDGGGGGDHDNGDGNIQALYSHSSINKSISDLKMILVMVVTIKILTRLKGHVLNQTSETSNR